MKAKMKSQIKSFAAFALFMLIAGITAVPLASAHCPLCTTGAVIGVGFARAYGVDDSIVGLFIGALIVSSALWFNKWLKKKVNFPMQELALVVASFLLLVIPFYYAGLITSIDMVKSMPTHHGMTGFGILGLADFGVDKLLFGIIVGTLVVWGVFSFSDYVKKKNGKVIWPYQGLSFMVIALALLTLVLWVVTKG